jgi:hypothetical protein
MHDMADEFENPKPKTNWWVALAPVAGLLVFFISGDVLRAELPQISIGLLFCLQTALAMAAFAVIAALVSPKQRLPMAELSGGNPSRFLGTITPFAAAIAATSWLALAYIETNGLSQPDHAVGIYTVPVHLKSVVRYLTPTQALIDRVAQWGFTGTILGMLAVTLLVRYFRKKRDQ